MIREEHSSSEEHSGALTFTRPRVASSEEHRRISCQDGVIKSRWRRQPPLHHASGESDQNNTFVPVSPLHPPRWGSCRFVRESPVKHLVEERRRHDLPPLEQLEAARILSRFGRYHGGAPKGGLVSGRVLVTCRTCPDLLGAVRPNF